MTLFYPLQPTRVILVRHGRSTYNDQGRYQGVSDEAVLTAQGRHDSYQTGIALQGTQLAAIYCSPLQRTRQTVEAIQSALQKGPHRPSIVRTDPCLQEIDLPEWEGLLYCHVRDVMRDSYQHWLDHPDQFQMTASLKKIKLRHAAPSVVAPSFQKFFPVRQLYEQVQYFWRNVLPRHSGETILVVSHGGTIRALISNALGISCEHYHKLQQSNCGVSVLEFGSPDEAHLKIMNDTHHLDEFLPKVKEGKQGVRLLLISDQSENIAHLCRLRNRLAPLDIQFCLSNGDRAHGMADQLFRDRRNILQLQTDRTDAHECWLQSLQPENLDHKVLWTGVMIASPQNLQAMVSQLIGRDTTLPITLGQGHFTVLHFPTTRKAPVLQSLNFGQGAAFHQSAKSGGYYPCAS